MSTHHSLTTLFTMVRSNGFTSFWFLIFLFKLGGKINLKQASKKCGVAITAPHPMTIDAVYPGGGGGCAPSCPSCHSSLRSRILWFLPECFWFSWVLTLSAERGALLSRCKAGSKSVWVFVCLFAFSHSSRCKFSKGRRHALATESNGSGWEGHVLPSLKETQGDMPLFFHW